MAMAMATYHHPQARHLPAAMVGPETTPQEKMPRENPPLVMLTPLPLPVVAVVGAPSSA